MVATFAGGVWLAPGSMARWRLVMTLIGTALIVSASNAFNMFLERDQDRLMERTRARPLPERRLSPEAALVFGTALACAALPLLFLAGNALTGILAGVAFFSYVAVYTPMKQQSPAALFVGAIPGAIPPLMGWTAATGRLDAPGLVLFAILFLWQIPHFLAIAIFRADDYERAGFRVLPLQASERATRIYILVFSIGARRGDDPARAAARGRHALHGGGGAAGRHADRLGRSPGSGAPPPRGPGRGRCSSSRSST